MKGKSMKGKSMKGKSMKGKSIGRKTLKRKPLKNKTLNIKGCAHNPTYRSLLYWYRTSFQQLGFMILEKHNGYNDKVSNYKTDVMRLRDCIAKKHSKMNNPDKKDDLKIMLDNVEVLIKHINKDF
jgi:hypothetical protein